MSLLLFSKNIAKENRVTGVLLVCCTIMSLTLSNTASGHFYIAFWQQKLCAAPYEGIQFPGTLLQFINEALMAVFFFSAGLEIKKEILTGQLNTFKKSLMPAISALGGMLVPALIYLVCCHSAGNYRGWAIPMATDIAFATAVLSLAGKRATLSMRVFLLAIAIFDDVGGIVTIAFFYASQIHWLYVALAAGAIGLLLLLRYFKVSRVALYLCGGLLLWYLIYNSGIHATIAGVLLALLLPPAFTGRLEQQLHSPVNFIILQLFALANTAIALPTDVQSILLSPVHYGILLALVLGKPVGIFLFAFLAMKANIAHLPGITLRQLLATGLVAGIGFTVSIFITSLAFTDERTQLIAKLAVLNASLLSGVAGYLFLKYGGSKENRQ